MFLHYPIAALQKQRRLLAHPYIGSMLNMFGTFDMGGQRINHLINHHLCIQQVGDRYSAPAVEPRRSLPLSQPATWTISVPQPIALRLPYILESNPHPNLIRTQFLAIS